MPTYEAGDARIRIIPDASRFLVDLENDLKRKRAEFAVDVTADTAAAAADIDQFIARQSGRDITVGVKVDRKRAQQGILDTLNDISDEVGNAFSAVGSGLKFPAIFAGIGELPAATLAITNVAGALQQLAGAGLVVPGVIGGVVAAFGTAKLGVSGVADAFTALQDASDGTEQSLQKADDALKSLAPSARDAVQAASDVTKELREALQQPVQQNLFTGVSADLRSLVAADLPILQKGLGGISTALNQNLRQVLTSLGSSTSTGLLDRILGNTADAQSRFTNAINPIVTAIGTLTAAGTDALPRLADGLTGVSTRFENFITEADQDGSLDRWINEGLDGFGHLGETVLNIGKVLGSITEAAGGDGGLLKMLEDGSTKLATFLNSAAGQNQLKEWFEEGREQIRDLVDLAGEVGPALKGMFEAGKQAADVLVPVVSDIVGFVNAIPGGAQTVVTAFLAWKTITAVGELAESLKAIGTLLSVTLPGSASTGAASMVAALGPVAAVITGITGGAVALNAYINPGPAITRNPGESLDAYLNRARDAGIPMPGLAPVSKPVPTPTDTGDLLGAPPAAPPPPPPDPKKVAGPVAGESGDPFAPGGALGGKPFIGPRPPGYATGGPTPSGRGNGPTGGFISELHGDEWVLPAHARAAIGDRALWAMTQGRSFLPGGYIDPNGNPITPGAAPGPVAPASPTGGVGSIANSFLGGLGGMFGNVSNLIGGASGAIGVGGSGSMGVGGSGLTPGFAGLMQAGSNPNLLGQWGQQTGDWLGTFAAKTLTSFGSTLFQGALGLFGLENSILSPNNTYTRAALQGAGFFLGNDGPAAQMLGAGQAGSDGVKPATDKQLREGSQSIDRADQRVAEILQRISELPGDAKQSQRLALDNDLTNARQDADDARTDMQGLQSRSGSSPGVGQLPRGVGDEQGLQVDTIRAKRAISAAFPQITEIGGYRQDALKWHPNGLAVDVMIPGGDTAGGANAQGKALGDQIYAYVMANKAALNVDYVLWQVKDHFNHLHVNTKGGGYPQGYQAGGDIPGYGGGDTVNALLEPGEHVLDKDDVRAMGGQNGVYAFRQALHFADGGGVPPLGALLPRPPVPDARELKPRPPAAPVRPAPAITTAPPPRPVTAAPDPADIPAPAPPPEPSTPAPVGGPAPVAASDGSVPSHTLPAISKGVTSGFAAAGNAVATAVQAAAAAGTFGAAGIGGGGGAGSLISGLFAQGGKIANDVIDVGSSFLVGNITPGTTDNAYGETLRPAPRAPQTAPLDGGRTYVFNDTHSDRIVDELRTKDAQDEQATLARYR